MTEQQQKQGFDLDEIFAGYEPDVRDGGEADPSLFILGELDEELRSKQRSSPTTTQPRSVNSPTEAEAPIPSSVGNTGIEDDADGGEQEENRRSTDGNRRRTAGEQEENRSRIQEKNSGGEFMRRTGGEQEENRRRSGEE